MNNNNLLNFEKGTSIDKCLTKLNKKNKSNKKRYSKNYKKKKLYDSDDSDDFNDNFSFSFTNKNVDIQLRTPSINTLGSIVIQSLGLISAIKSNNNNNRY